MDSISHTYLAGLLLDHVEETMGVSFDPAAFRYGNLKPDLTGTYLTKRHYPSLMFDEVKDKLRAFCRHYTIGRVNGRDLSVDLGEICHYITDFFCYPHNDDIYDRNLLAHYIYEKRITLSIRRRLNEARYQQYVAQVKPACSVEHLIARLDSLHARYHALSAHGIGSDLEYMAHATALLLTSVVNIAYESEGAPARVTA